MGASVRYIVDDVDGAIDFYNEGLGSEVKMRPASGFAALFRNELRLFLNVPGAWGAGSAGGDLRPGSWNRFQIEVDDLDELVETLRQSDVTFRGDLVEGQGGRRVLAEDPSGNLVELFEPKAS